MILPKIVITRKNRTVELVAKNYEHYHYPLKPNSDEERCLKRA